VAGENDDALVRAKPDDRVDSEADAAERNVDDSAADFAVARRQASRDRAIPPFGAVAAGDGGVEPMRPTSIM
jgi:hypothetical protein